MSEGIASIERAAISPPALTDRVDDSGSELSESTSTLLPGIVGPIAVMVAYRAYAVVAGNLGSRVNLVQLVMLAGATMIVLVFLAIALHKAGLDGNRVGFAAAASFWLSTQSTWFGLGALTGSLAAAVLAAVLTPVAATAACYQIRNPAFRTLVLTFIVLSGSLPTIGPVVSLLRSDPTVEPVAMDFGTPTASRDLIVVVLDEYARGDALVEDFGFDNREFTDALAEEGIDVVPQAWANSSRTITSIATVMSGQYLVEPGQTYNLRDRRRIAAMVGGDNPMADLLRANGYRYTHIEGPAVDVECSSSPDVCIGNGLIDETTTVWLQSNPYVGLVTWSLGHPFPNTADDILGSLQAVVEEASTNSQPDFVYAHVLSPHIPLELDSSCDRHQMFAETNTYIGQIQCVNGLVLEALAGSVDEAVVVVTGDHGTVDDRSVLDGDPANWTQVDIKQRLGVFSAVKLAPECSTPSDDATLVTIFHLAAACALGVEPDPPVERTFIVEGIPTDANGILEIDLDELRSTSTKD
ncbi:MAG: LTA synthase family protein [Acidimicrobiia bacterium]|nr:LTA synthase family protein [Acidimicrobiia bacterium]